jgi:glycerol-3-phosphate dehydrogenase (NAD(P)+)
MLIGQGVAPAEAVKEVGMVVEGINALPAAMRLAEQYAVEIPLTAAVNAVVEGSITAEQAVSRLMARQQHPEGE